MGGNFRRLPAGKWLGARCGPESGLRGCPARGKKPPGPAVSARRGEARQSGGSLSSSCPPWPQTLRPTTGPLLFPPILTGAGGWGGESRRPAGPGLSAGGKPPRLRGDPFLHFWLQFRERIYRSLRWPGVWDVRATKRREDLGAPGAEPHGAPPYPSFRIPRPPR